MPALPGYLTVTLTAATCVVGRPFVSSTILNWAEPLLPLAGIERTVDLPAGTWLAHHLEALGHLELAARNLDAARGALDPVIPMLRETGLGEWSVHPVHPDLIEALVHLGELDEAVAPSGSGGSRPRNDGWAAADARATR